MACSITWQIARRAITIRDTPELHRLHNFARHRYLRTERATDECSHSVTQCNSGSSSADTVMDSYGLCCGKGPTLIYLSLKYCHIITNTTKSARYKTILVFYCRHMHNLSQYTKMYIFTSRIVSRKYLQFRWLKYILIRPSRNQWKSSTFIPCKLCYLYTMS